MPDLSPTIDGELEDIHSDFSGVNIETIAEDTAASVSLNNSTTTMKVQWVNTSNIAVQPAQIVMEFDTSDISDAPESATLKIYPESSNNGGVDFYVVRTFLTSDGSIVAGDNPSWTRSSAGGTPDVNNITKYSSEIDYSEDITEDELNSITLNSTALSDMASRDKFQISLVCDFLVDQSLGGVTDGITRKFIISSQDHSTTAQRPVLSYTEAAAPRTQGNLHIVGGTHTIIGSNIVIK